MSKRKTPFFMASLTLLSQTDHPLAQWGESQSCLVTASLQGGGGMVAAITSDREHFIHHTTGDAAICVISSSGDLVTVVSVSQDLVMHRGFITLESDHIQVDLRKKVLAVFCIKCETMSEGAVQNTTHYNKQHLASGVVKVCTREGCQQAFQTWHELREHRKDCSYHCSVISCRYTDKRKRKVVSHFKRVHRYN